MLKLATVLACFVALPLGAATEEVVPGVKFAELEIRWNNAHLNADVGELSALWSEEMTIVVPSMEPMSKSQALKFWEIVPVKFQIYETEVMSTREFGEMAIVLGRLHRERAFGEERAEDHWLFTKVYHLEKGQWRVVSYQASPAPEK